MSLLKKLGYGVFAVLLSVLQPVNGQVKRYTLEYSPESSLSLAS